MPDRKLFYVQASPRGEKSASLRVAGAFVAALKRREPGLAVEELELFKTRLPEFDRVASQGKYAIIHGTEAAPEVKAAFGKVAELIERFKAADLYVFAVPMWNFGIPYVLKHFLDLVLQPTYTFAAGKDGYRGLLSGKKAFVAYARGGDYGEDAAVDFQKRYLEFALGFMGIKDVSSVIAQPMLAAGPEVAASKLAEASRRAEELAATF